VLRLVPTLLPFCRPGPTFLRLPLSGQPALDLVHMREPTAKKRASPSDVTATPSCFHARTSLAGTLSAVGGFCNTLGQQTHLCLHARPPRLKTLGCGAIRSPELSFSLARPTQEDRAAD